MIMTKLSELKKHLKRGTVYRRTDLARWSKSVDRHLEALVAEGTLQKLSHGMYYFPKLSAFGQTPPDEDKLVRKFLNDDHFLLTSPNVYNSLGLGTTQLYNVCTVYNFKRHGEFQLGNRKYNFQQKYKFPKKLTEEFLLVDLVNNLKKLAEDPNEILSNLKNKVSTMDARKLHNAVVQYGSPSAKRIFEPMTAGIQTSVYGS